MVQNQGLRSWETLPLKFLFYTINLFSYDFKLLLPLLQEAISFQNLMTHGIKRSQIPLGSCNTSSNEGHFRQPPKCPLPLFCVFVLDCNYFETTQLVQILKSYPQNVCRLSGRTLESVYSVSGNYQIYQTERKDPWSFILLKIVSITKKKTQKNCSGTRRKFFFFP